MRSFHSFLFLIAVLIILVPTAVHAQGTDPAPRPLPGELIPWQLSVDSLAAERAERPPSVVIRSDWTKADVLLGARRGVPTETVRLTKNDRARYPVVNYAIQTIAANACVQRVPNTETARCFPRRLNGTPVTRYPGIITDEPLQHPDPFVQRPGRHTP